MREKYLILFFSLISFVVCGIIIGLYTISDRKAPEISFSPVDIVYEEGMDKSIFLNGISAYDEKDGDVTNLIVIEKTKIASNGNEVIVTYVARDNSYNVSKLSRVFAYRKKSNDNSYG